LVVGAEREPGEIVPAATVFLVEKGVESGGRMRILKTN
jgi:hypothetical protein